MSTYISVHQRPGDDISFRVDRTNTAHQEGGVTLPVLRIKSQRADIVVYMTEENLLDLRAALAETVQ